MSKPVLHQVTTGATPGDAITDSAFLLRRWLREMGYASEIYAHHIHPDLEREVRSFASYHPRRAEPYLIYHHSIGSPVVEPLLEKAPRLILVYHNITPPEFFTSVDPAMASMLEEGAAQLPALCPRTEIALGVSPYNERDLRAAGYPRTGVLPITLDEAHYDLPSNPDLVARYQGQGPLLLYVGRLVPNKRQEDLIKLLYFYRRIQPSARLVLVGSAWLRTYSYWLRSLATTLHVQDAVIIADHISQQDLVTYYRLADLYVSMSEHEGFGKPLIESMHLGLPVLAYASSAVPETMADAGVLFHQKDYEALAELVDMLVNDQVLRARIIRRQHARAQSFLEPQVRQVWERLVRALPW